MPVCYHSSGGIAWFYAKKRYIQLYYRLFSGSNSWIFEEKKPFVQELWRKKAHNEYCDQLCPFCAPHDVLCESSVTSNDSYDDTTYYSIYEYTIPQIIYPI